MSDIVLKARLADDAQARMTRDGQHLLMLRAALPGGDAAGHAGKAITVRAVQQFGTGPAAAIACRNRAHHLRRGVRVTLSGAAISWHRGMAQLDGLEWIDTPDMTQAHNGIAR
ncbi:hypothetical protein [Acidovorax sp.]|uniref:hypothetical protein n=1 Tax=Acidovorax sp. TaxID=1872122 RepID=UPI0025858B86|nr:hypothetical protein [Acidovorax sp.]